MYFFNRILLIVFHKTGQNIAVINVFLCGKNLKFFLKVLIFIKMSQINLILFALIIVVSQFESTDAAWTR